MNPTDGREVRLNRQPLLGLVSSRVRRALVPAAAFGVGFIGTLEATDVPGNSNLATIINGILTPGPHEYNLLGDVSVSGIAYFNTTNRLDVYIEGNGHTITKANNESIFWITGATPNASLTIRNANITSVNTGGSWGTISIDALSPNARIDLDGTKIYGTTGVSGQYSAGLTTFSLGTQVAGKVEFDANRGQGDGAGAVAVGSAASLLFEDEVTFTNNYTDNYGGAVSVYSGGSLTFDKKATFLGNHALNYFGGAIDLWGNLSTVHFNDGADFSGNYVKNSANQTYGVRGGAINIGYLTGASAEPQLVMQGVSEFTGNYVWGSSATPGAGGAIAITAVGAPLIGSNVPTGSAYYHSAVIDQGLFTDNYAYSDTGGGYGGAVFLKTIGDFTFGDGTAFEGNMAKTYGGAIYAESATIHLEGDVTFSGNRQGVTFSTTDGVLIPDISSGAANAIYFARGVNQGFASAGVMLNAGAGKLIDFGDPIESASDVSILVVKEGLGTVRFRDHNSDVLARTTVEEGTFELGDNVAYGRTGTSVNSYFHLNAGATLKGGAGATLLAADFDLDGRIEVAQGVFNFSGADVVFGSTTVLSLTITNANTYSSIDLNGAALDLNDAILEVIALGYKPSMDITDEFVIVTGLSGQAQGEFMQGALFEINGAEFAILYLADNISLKQVTAPPIPEPATYVLITALGVACLVWKRRSSRAQASLLHSNKAA
jgi:predicted outer membrane repeat protein